MRILRWTGVVAAVVLSARTLAYALAPDPRAEALGRVTGGPRPVVVAAVALVLAALIAAVVLWLSALGVRERHRLRPGGAAPRLRLAPVLGRALAIAIGTFGALAAGVYLVDWPTSRAQRPADPTMQLGTALIGPNMLTMIVLGLALFATIVTTVVLATHRGRYDRYGDRLDRERPDDPIRGGLGQ